MKRLHATPSALMVGAAVLLLLGGAASQVSPGTHTAKKDFASANRSTVGGSHLHATLARVRFERESKRLESQSVARIKSGIAWDQAPLLEEATKIQRLAIHQRVSGFTGTALVHGKLVLYWHGTLPAVIHSLIKHLATPVAVRSAAYTFAELNTEARRLSRLPGVLSVGALSDFSGLRVSLAAGYSTPNGQLHSMPNVQQLSTTVRLVPGKASPSPAYWRWDDVSPFWGGDVVQSPSEECTGGFAIRYPSGGQWHPGMTLSNHCGANAQWKTPVSGTFVGNTGAGNGGLDGNYLSGSNYDPDVYIGADNSASGLSINGALYPTLGASVCYDGGFSGASCNNIIDTYPAYALGWGPGYWTDNANGQPADGNGDSGGPVLAPSTGSGLNGIGIITAIDLSQEVPCQGVPAGNGRNCSPHAFAMSLPDVLNGQGIQLQIVP